MTEIPKKNAPARFEQTSGAMPRLATPLSAESLRPEASLAATETGQSDVRSIRVAKLDHQTVWRMIELLKSL
jgi:hypothetical protein